MILVIVFGSICLLLRSGFTVAQLGFYVTESKTGLVGAAILLTRYLTATVIVICFLNLIPETSIGITALGTMTLPVYLFHNLPGLRNLIYRICPFHNSLPLSLCWWTVWSCFAVLIPAIIFRAIENVKKMPDHEM